MGSFFLSKKPERGYLSDTMSGSRMAISIITTTPAVVVVVSHFMKLAEQRSLLMFYITKVREEVSEIEV